MAVAINSLCLLVCVREAQGVRCFLRRCRPQGGGGARGEGGGCGGGQVLGGCRMHVEAAPLGAAGAWYP